jgi:predicted DNA-binding antitoxin AbrB/MazE fold protein
MTTIRARWEQGVFRPIRPVNLPEATEVDVVVPTAPPDEVETPKQKRDREEILEILSRSYDSGQTDTAERHNEHQP